MAKSKKKNSIFNKLRNYFFAGVVVLVPLGFTLYLTIFLISVSSNIIPKEINPNNYLPFSIPGSCGCGGVGTGSIASTFCTPIA